MYNSVSLKTCEHLPRMTKVMRATFLFVQMPSLRFIVVSHLLS